MAVLASCKLLNDHLNVVFLNTTDVRKVLSLISPTGSVFVLKKKTSRDQATESLSSYITITFSTTTID